MPYILKHSATALVLLITVLCCTPAGAASPVRLLKDLDTYRTFGYGVSRLCRVEQTVFFFLNDETHGRELWRMDGTAASMRLVKDITPGTASTNVKAVCAAGPWLYAFVESNNYYELWKSDGTAGGTTRVHRFASGYSAYWQQQMIVTENGVFLNLHGSWRSELWRTDGTPAGTILLKASSMTDGMVDEFVTSGGQLFFSTIDDVNGRELWRSDGTVAGTQMVKNIRAGTSSSSPAGLAVMNGVVYFSATDDSLQTELWRSDGTAAGTSMVKDIHGTSRSSAPQWLTAVGGTLYFFAVGASGTYELWKTDGTDGGTVFVWDSGSANPYSISDTASAGGILYFSADQPTTERELWRSDGTTAGTRMVKDIPPLDFGSNPSKLTAVGNRIFFTAFNPSTRIELYVSNGTAAGTRLVKDILKDDWMSPDISDITPFGDGVLFSATDGIHGWQIWKSDGTTATMLLPPFATSATDGITIPGSLVVGDTMYFSVFGSSYVDGLWRTDGTTGGTRRINRGYDLRLDGSEGPMIAMGGRVFFVCANPSRKTSELWRSDGTTAGTAVLDAFSTTSYGGKGISNLTIVGSKLFFTVNTAGQGIELWCTEGRFGTTRLVRDIVAGAASSTPLHLYAVDEVLYFTADDGIHGRELWRSDGTEAGTLMVRDIRPGAASSIEANDSDERPFRMVRTGDDICFTATDDSHGAELWRSDGTEAGTELLTDLRAGSSGAYPYGLTEVNGRIYFTAYTPATGPALWSTDGTEGGTSLAWMPSAEYASVDLGYLTATESGLFFTINNSELWASDGTQSGTRLLKANPGWYMKSFVAVDGMVFFKGTTLDQGTELWQSDGTETGTTLVKDLTNDSGSSNATPLGRAGGHLIFQATTERYGSELWVAEHGQQPSLLVTGNGKVIRNGDLSPEGRDFTDFTTVSSNTAPQEHRFTVRNTTGGVLTLAGPAVKISGLHASDFVLTAWPKTVLAKGESSHFQIRFRPSANGMRRAVVHLAANEGFNIGCSFAIQGDGGPLPSINQTITFHAPAKIPLTATPVPLLAWSSSGLPVKLEVFSGPATLSGQTLIPSGEGVVVLRAGQVGDERHREATPVYRNVEVLSASSSGGMFEGLHQVYDGFQKPVSWIGASPPLKISYKVGGIWQFTPPVNAGSYPVTAVITDTTERHATLVIQKVPLFVQADHKRKFAGQLNPPLTMTTSGFVNTETETVLKSQPVLKTTATKSSPGGTYSIQSSGGSATNYTLIHRTGTLRVETFAGAYESLLEDSTTLPAGKLSLLVPGSNGSFTGKLQLRQQDAVMPLAGVLTIDPNAETGTCMTIVERNGTVYQINVVLDLQGGMNGYVLGAGAMVVGTTSQGAKISQSSAPYAGKHTVVLEPALPAGPGIPAGAGWATCDILSQGTLNLAGKLPDGTAFSTALSPDESPNPGYRLFVQPYVPSRSQSVLCGTFSLLPHPTLAARRHVNAAELSWTKAGLANDSSYSSGFGAVKTIMTLDPWLKPTTTTSLKSLLGISQTLAISHSATGSPSDANLPTQLLLTGGNLLTVQSPLPNTTRWTGNLDTAKGTLTGSFELLDGTVKRTVPFTGVLRQPTLTGDTVIGDGHFLLPPLPSNPATGKVSGEVLLQR